LHGTIPPSERSRYLGSAACAGCHPAEAGQQRTRHASTLARVDPRREAERFRLGAEADDPGSDVSYRTAVNGRRCVMQASDGAQMSEAAPEYVFGSGKVAYTYVARADDRWLELRMSYYGWVHRWDFTPGLRPGSPVNSALGLRLD